MRTRKCDDVHDYAIVAAEPAGNQRAGAGKAGFRRALRGGAR
jgi:hypothetical protein